MATVTGAGPQRAEQTGAIETAGSKTSSKTAKLLEVMALHRAHAVSGVRVAGARLARLPAPHHPWRPLIMGSNLTSERLGATPLADAPGLDVLSLPTSHDPVRDVLLLRTRLRGLGTRVVVPNDLPHGFIAAGLDAHRGLRCAAVCHGNDFSALDLYRRCLPLADAWCGVSAQVSQRARPLAPAGRERIVTPCGLPVPVRAAPMVQPLPPERAIRLLYSGWLDHQNKRSLDLLDLAAALKEAGVEFRLTIAGDGPVREQLERGLAAFVGEGLVSFVGTVGSSDMVALYERHDLALLLSRSEGSPLAVMEAMAAGRGVAITTGCGGAVQAVRDGVEGIVVATGAVREMAARIARLAAHPGELEAMGLAAHAGARRHFDINVLAPSYDDLVERAADARAWHDLQAGSPAPDAVAVQWGRILGALEMLGPSDPSALAIDWLNDLGVRGVTVDLARAEPGLVPALADTPGLVARVVADDAAGRSVLGWQTIRADEIGAGSLVLTRRPEAFAGAIASGAAVMSLRLPGMLSPASELFLGAVRRLRALGVERIALYGAGRHTRRLRDALELTPEVVGVVDDRAGETGGPGASLWGYPIVKPERCGELGIQAVIVSSDEYEDQMLERAAIWGNDLTIVPLYRET